jgi:signal transduction histidine kinase
MHENRLSDPERHGWRSLWRRWLAVFLLFQPGVVLLFLWRYRATETMSGENMLPALVWDTAINDLTWGILLFPLLALLRRSPLVLPGLWKSLVVLGVSVPVFIYLHVAVYLGLYALSGPDMEPPLESYSAVWIWFMRLNPLWRALHLCFLLLLNYCCDFHALYVEKARRAAELQAELATARLHALQMQLQPHFLFNTLHAIHVLVQADPEASCRMIEQLSRLLRITLERSQSPEVSLGDELNSLEPYLNIEKTRFQDRLTVELDIASDTMGALVPALVLQPLVENAVKHGISQRPGLGFIKIRSSRTNGTLILEVCDNGRGPRGRTDSLGIGLSNLRNRLQCLYGERQSLAMVALEPEGASVRVELPYRLAPPPAGNDRDVHN